MFKDLFKKNKESKSLSFKKGMTKSDIIAAVEDEKLAVAREWINLNEAKIVRGMAYHMKHLCTQFVHLNNVPDNNPWVDLDLFVTALKEKYSLLDTNFGFIARILQPMPSRDKGMILIFFQKELEQEQPLVLDDNMMDFAIDHCDIELCGENYPIISKILKKMGEEREERINLAHDILEEK